MSRPTSMKVDGTVYWTLATYDADGVLVDADSTPTVAVRKNGSSVGDVITVTKRAATTGIYDCSHAPSGEAEGDCFTYEESATISTVSYMNPWSIEVLAVERGTDSALLAADKPTNFDLLAVNGSGEVTTSNPASGGGSAHTAADVANLILVTPANKLATDASGNVEANNMRGTDGANTVVPNTVAPDNASITAILADTNELQGNQGDWATATGFNTVAPDNASITAILADTADLQANQGDWLTATTTVASNMRGTDGANTVAPVDVSSDVAAILADTNELQLNQGQWLTATGFNTVAPDNAGIASNGLAIAALNDFDPSSDVVAHVTLVDTTTDLTNGGGSGSCPTAQEIVDAWGNQDQSVYVTQGTLGYYLDAQVSSAGSGGSGLYQATVRVQDTNGDALQGARVNVDGTTLTLATGSSGEVTFNLDSGVYLLEVSPPAGYVTPTGQVVTVTNTDPSDTVFSLESNGGCSPVWIG